jgi:Zn-dependent M28 family amino/carboxypeptidase
VQRGTCPFLVKAANADDAGAGAMILFNQGNTSDREGLMEHGVAMLDMIPDHPEHGVGIPVVFATYSVGEGVAALLETETVVMHVQVEDTFEIRTSENLITETAGGDSEEVVFFGAFLDSHPDSPGINEGGSGIATVLEIARLVASCEPARRMRFAFWATIKWGSPWGSLQYLGDMTEEEKSDILMYLHVDTLGSPNYAVFVFDGDGSAFWIEGPPGSAEVERFFVADMMLQGLPTVPHWSGGADNFSFEMHGIAYGGVQTGIGVHIKTDEEAELFGGTAGEPYDPCQNEACDTIDNMNMDLAATLAGSFARSAQFFGLDGLWVPPVAP